MHSTTAAAYPLADRDFHRVSRFLDASLMSHRWCSKQRRTLYSFSPTKPSVITKIPSTHSADATFATILASPPEPVFIHSAHGKLASVQPVTSSHPISRWKAHIQSACEKARNTHIQSACGKARNTCRLEPPQPLLGSRYLRRGRFNHRKSSLVSWAGAHPCRHSRDDS